MNLHCPAGSKFATTHAWRPVGRGRARKESQHAVSIKNNSKHPICIMPTDIDVLGALWSSGCDMRGCMQNLHCKLLRPTWASPHASCDGPAMLESPSGVWVWPCASILAKGAPLTGRKVRKRVQKGPILHQISAFWALAAASRACLPPNQASR